MIVEALAPVLERSPPSAFVDDVEDRLSGVNERLFATSLESNAGMSGSTVAVLLAFGRHCLSLWAGDSRIYRWREGAMVQITRDHSEVQEMLDGGVPDAQQHGASNVITRAVGNWTAARGTEELVDPRMRAQYNASFPEGAFKNIKWYPAIPWGLEELEGRILDRIKAAN